MNDYGFKRSVGTLTITAVVFLALVLAGVIAHNWYTQRLLREQRADVRAEVSLAGNALSAAIDRRLNLVSGVAAMSREGASPLVVERFYEAFAESTPGIGAIALAPGGAITYAYPQQENQHLLGSNLLRHPNLTIRAGAERARVTTELVVGGPVDVPGRAQSMVAQQAIYRERQFSELIYLDFSLSPILARAGLGMGSDPFAVVLHDQAGNLIYGNGDVLSQDPVIYQIELPDGIWELAAIPIGGWAAAARSAQLIFDVFVVVIIGLTTGIAFLAANRQARLQNAVELRTRELTVVNRQLQKDIVERERVESALRESELRLANILNLAGEAIIAVDEAQSIILFNKAAETVFGYRAAEILGQPLARLIPEPLVHNHGDHVPDFDGGQTGIQPMFHPRSLRGRRQDGSEFPAEASVSRVVQDGETTFTVVMRDISQRQRMENELREREQQYRTIFESVSDGIFINALDGRRVAFNPAAARMYGYTPEEFSQISLSELLHPDSVAILEESIRRAQAGESWRSPRAAGRHKDGSLVYGDAIGTLIQYQGTPHVLFVSRDVTDEVMAFKLLEERVEERTRELSTLLDISHDVAATLDLERLLSSLFDHCKRIVDYHSLTLSVVENEERLLWHVHRELASGLNMVPQRGTREHNLLPIQDSARLREPLIIPDVRAATPEAENWRRNAEMVLGGIPDHAVCWMAVPLLVKDRLIGILSFLHDQPGYYTERAAQLAMALANHAAVAIENARLFQAVERGAEQLRAISELGQRINSILDIDELLTQTVHLIQDAFGYYHVHIGLIEGDVVVLASHAGVWHNEPECRHCASLHLWLGQEAICSQVASTGDPMLVSDISQEPRYLHPAGATGAGIVVPLKVKGRVIGLLDVENNEVNSLDQGDVAVLQLLANQVAVAIENARLFKREQRQAEQLRSIAEVSRQVTGVLAVNELANRAAYLIQQAFGYYHVHIGIIEEDAVIFRPKAGVWRDEPECHYCDKHRFLVGEVGASGQVAATGEPLLVRNVQQDARYLPMDDRQTGSALVLPLKVRGQIIGVLNMESDAVDGFSEADIGALQPLANQLVVALENARLYEQAQRLAALQERQKLARELHDSVSQALFGIGLGTRTALKLVESDGVEKSGLTQPLEYILSLATAGLAEMRALIFELRPETLDVEGLIPALTRRVEALRTRHEIDVEAVLEDEPELPVAAKETLYRVAQEALHNVVKHAHARTVAVSLTGVNGDVVLEIRDDGCGFEIKDHFPGHLGLQSMHERVQDAGGVLAIESAPGQGTLVRVVLAKTGSVGAGQRSLP